MKNELALIPTPEEFAIYKMKIKEHEVIFDSKDEIDFLLSFLKKRPNGPGIWVGKYGNKEHNLYAMMFLNNKNTRIHHLLMGYPLEGFMIDHINGNGLDNRRKNLRVVSRSQNRYNTKLKGKLPRWVVKQKNGKYQAIFRFGLGTYNTAEEAHEVAMKYAKTVHGNLILPEYFEEKNE